MLNQPPANDKETPTEKQIIEMFADIPAQEKPIVLSRIFSILKEHEITAPRLVGIGSSATKTIADKPN